MLPFIIQGANIVLYVNGAPVIIDSTHMNYEMIKTAIREQDWESVQTLATVKAAVAKVSNGRVSVSEDEVLFDGTPVHNALSRRMLQMFAEGFPITHFCKFMENLDANPSFRARNELYGFLEACNLPITDDGCFLAYKKIRSDWKDCYTGKIDNSIGAKPTMARRDVNEDPNQTCSAGLHVCSYSYLSSYSGERIVAVKVNPADCVSVPTDYNNAKMRVCAYEVVEELPFDSAQKDDTLSTGPVVRTGYVRPAPVKKSYRVEDVLSGMSVYSAEFDKLCDELHLVSGDYGGTDEIMADVKIGLIRKAIDSLGLA